MNSSTREATLTKNGLACRPLYMLMRTDSIIPFVFFPPIIAFPSAFALILLGILAELDDRRLTTLLTRLLHVGFWSFWSAATVDATAFLRLCRPSPASRWAEIVYVELPYVLLLGLFLWLIFCATRTVAVLAQWCLDRRKQEKKRPDDGKGDEPLCLVER